MAFTRHGHHIPGTVLGSERAPWKARCGGPAICPVCMVDVGQYDERINHSNDIPPHTHGGTDAPECVTCSPQNEGNEMSMPLENNPKEQLPPDKYAAVAGASPILRYFRFEHLPHYLQAASEPYYAMAVRLDLTLPNGPEKSVALRKLLESKDAAVRAMVR